MKNFQLGEKFQTRYNIRFRSLFVPRDTVFEITEVYRHDDYKVHFYCGEKEHPECDQFMRHDEIEEIMQTEVNNYLFP